MEAIVLAGGLGTRLKKIVPNLPKPMADINGKPFLEIILQKLSIQGFKRIILSTCYKSKIIEDYFGRKFKDMEIIYSVEEKPLGTGGAIKKSLEMCNLSNIFIFNGDTYLEIDFNQLNKFMKKDNRNILVCTEVKDVSRYGSVIINEGHIIELKEKNNSGKGFINAGCYVLRKDIFHDYNETYNFNFEKEFLQKLIKNKDIIPYEVNGMFIDIGIPEDYLKAKKYLINQ